MNNITVTCLPTSNCFWQSKSYLFIIVSSHLLKESIEINQIQINLELDSYNNPAKSGFVTNVNETLMETLEKYLQMLEIYVNIFIQI